MTKQINIFRKMDNFLKLQVSDLKNHSIYQNIIANIDSLEEPFPKFIYHSFNYIFISIPIIITTILLFNNISHRQNLTLKKNIIKKIVTLESTFNKFNQQKKLYLIAPSTQTQIALNGKLTSILNRLNLGNNLITIKKFNKTKLVENISKIKAILSFKQISTKSFSKITNILVNNENINLTKINISKSITTGTLFGELQLQYLTE